MDDGRSRGVEGGRVVIYTADFVEGTRVRFLCGPGYTVCVGWNGAWISRGTGIVYSRDYIIA